jgi:hypothetical protein
MLNKYKCVMKGDKLPCFFLLTSVIIIKTKELKIKLARRMSFE